MTEFPPGTSNIVLRVYNFRTQAERCRKEAMQLIARAEVWDEAADQVELALRQDDKRANMTETPK